jgi:hypothetical protein
MKIRSIILSAIFLFVLSALSAPIFAHEGREVAEYELHFGWRVEPAYAGLLNGPEVFIAVHQHEGEATPETPVDISTLEVNLQAEVTFGDQTTTLTLRPAWGETGHYIAELIPTLPGDYSFHLTGTIGDVAVDEIFTSADGEFSSVEPTTDVMFPSLPAVDNARIEALEARIAELETLVAELQGN